MSREVRIVRRNRIRRVLRRRRAAERRELELARCTRPQRVKAGMVPASSGPYLRVLAAGAVGGAALVATCKGW